MKLKVEKVNCSKYSVSVTYIGLNKELNVESALEELCS